MPVIGRESWIINRGKILWCFPSKSLTIEARTKTTGYIPEQTINLDINVKNKSDKMLDIFRAELIRVK